MVGKRVSEEEWKSGKGVSGNLEKEKVILEVLEEKSGMDIKEVIELSKVKWVYSSLVRLEKVGKVERKKIGKCMYYRKVKVK